MSEATRSASDDEVSSAPPDAFIDAVLAAPPPEPPASRAFVPDVGRRRRRTAAIVVAVAVVAGLAGGVIGNRIQSPADRAASSRPPRPSLITVPVERRALSTELVLAGQVAYNEPTIVQLAGSVGIAAGDAAVVTDIVAVGDDVREGDAFVEVTGRPVIALQGDVPMYRRLVIGSEGPDVTQLEAALVRLGYPLASVDSVFDAATAAAVEQLYMDAGHAAQGPSAEEREGLVAAQDAVRQAEDNVRTAQDAVNEARRPMRESERLQLERSLQSARQAVPDARAAGDAARAAGDQAVATAQATRDAALVARDAAAALRDLAASGAIDPDTGLPYTSERVARLQVEAAAAQEALVAADAALRSAQIERDRAIAGAQRAIADAEFQLQLTEAQYGEATAPGDTSQLDAAVATAQAALTASTEHLVALQASTGVRISPGEIVFVPVLPSTMTEVYVSIGQQVQGPLGTLATSSTLIRARVSRVDSALVAVGAPVEVEIRGSGITTTGTVLSVGTPATRPGGTPDDGPFPAAAEGTGRLEVTIAPDDPQLVSQYVFWDARVVLPVASTDGDVLVVPVAALTVGPDQVSQVEVERVPATATDDAVTELVDVEVGLTANGLAEVRPIVAGTLVEGDRVVVGVETNERLNEDADRDGPSVPTDTDDEGDEGNDRGDGGEVDSPLAALLGWTSNPVEDRRRQLEVEDLVADCMRDRGFEYQPVDFSSQINADEELQFGDPEKYGERYGYGVMRSYELYEVGGGMDAPEFVDPNQEYVNGLSPDEQQAYYEALYGQAAIASPEGELASDTPPDVPPEQQGCQMQAHEQVFGDDASTDPEIQAALEEIFMGIENDPRFDQVERGWAECMAPTLDDLAVENPPTEPNGMWGVIETFKVEAQGLEAIPFETEAEMNDYFESGEQVYSAYTNADGSGYVYLGQPQEIPGQEIDRLAELEVELWKADRACQVEVGFADVRRQVEQDAVDDLLGRFPQLGES